MSRRRGVFHSVALVNRARILQVFTMFCQALPPATDGPVILNCISIRPLDVNGRSRPWFDAARFKVVAEDPVVPNNATAVASTCRPCQAAVECLFRNLSLSLQNVRGVEKLSTPPLDCQSRIVRAPSAEAFWPCSFSELVADPRQVIRSATGCRRKAGKTSEMVTPT